MEGVWLLNRYNALPGPDDKERFVRRMFADIAGRYDLLNTLLSARFDRLWRRVAARMARVQPASRILDVCCGTGELAFRLHRASGGATVMASDFVAEMLAIGAAKARRRGTPDAFVPVLANALDLPFADDVFDAVTVAFGIRNVADTKGGIAEMTRVARRGGRVVILEFTRLRSRLFRALFGVYFSRILPVIGNAVSRSRAYSYLSASVSVFPNADELASMMRECGLTNVRYRLLTFGIVAAHVGEKA